ncbi:MAG: hypothetical protein KDD39_07090 [Bdellovibrionales bacterium]|nr:hypothetical protein [Bdellovibrionales bacterium]
MKNIGLLALVFLSLNSFAVEEQQVLVEAKLTNLSVSLDGEPSVLKTETLRNGTAVKVTYRIPITVSIPDSCTILVGQTKRYIKNSPYGYDFPVLEARGARPSNETCATLIQLAPSAFSYEAVYNSPVVGTTYSEYVYIAGNWVKLEYAHVPANPKP